MTITARNYAAHAQRVLMDELRRMESIPGAMRSEKMDAKVELTTFISAKFKDAVHFALPDGASLFDDDLRGIRGQRIRLPYPVVTIEWFDPVRDPSMAYIPKRVAVAIEVSSDEIDIPGGASRGILLAGMREYEGKWIASNSFSVIAEDWERTLTPGESMGHLFDGKPGAVSIHKVTYAWDFEHYDDVAERLGLDVAEDELSVDINNEGYALLQFCEAMSCSNVGTTTIGGAPAAVNARRIKGGKLPLLETKILTVEVPGQARAVRIDGEPRESGSVRQHLRRGHIRRIAGDRRIWVNSCVVGNPERGRIEKDYRVRAVSVQEAA